MSPTADMPFATLCGEDSAPWSASEAAVCSTVREDTWTGGLQPTDRPMSYGENSWLSTIIVAAMVLLALNIRHVSRVFREFPKDLLGIRTRSNAFDDERANSGRTSLLLILLLSLTEGILLYSAGATAGLFTDVSHIFADTMMLGGLALTFYLAQLAVYIVAGYTFTDSESAVQWVRGFRASQSLLAFMLIAPSLVALFYPSSSPAMLTIAIIAYVIARLFFIIKGFKIFYNGLLSLFYFILYLCTLEITPLMIVRRLAIDIMRW